MNLQIFLASWRAFGHFLGGLLGRVAMTIFYFTVFAPFAVGVVVFGDPLQIKTTPQSLWRPRTTGDQDLASIMRQF